MKLTALEQAVIKVFCGPGLYPDVRYHLGERRSSKRFVAAGSTRWSAIGGQCGQSHCRVDSRRQTTGDLWEVDVRQHAVSG